MRRTNSRVTGAVMTVMPGVAGRAVAASSGGSNALSSAVRTHALQIVDSRATSKVKRRLAATTLTVTAEALIPGVAIAAATRAAKDTRCSAVIAAGSSPSQTISKSTNFASTVRVPGGHVGSGGSVLNDTSHAWRTAAKRPRSPSSR